MTFLQSVPKKIATLLAILVILAAIAVSLMRILTPLIDSHRAEIEKLASTVVEKPVTIQKVRFSWYQYQPVISLDAVSILDETAQRPILSIKEVKIFFSIPQSVWQRKFIPSGMVISGSDVNVDETAPQQYTLQGVFTFPDKNIKPNQQAKKFAAMAAVLMAQPRLILEDINLRYQALDGKRQFFTLYHLSLQNAGERHKIMGKIILHQDLPTTLSLIIQWRGKEIDLTKIRAKIYVYLSGFSLQQWLKGKSFAGWQINEGLASAKIWVTYNRGVFKRVQTTFQAYNLNVYSLADKTPHLVNRLSGNVGFQREGQSLVFAGDDILIDLPKNLWPLTNFYVSLFPDEKGALHLKALRFGYVNLSDAQTYLARFLSPTAQKQLAALQLSGSLHNASVVLGGAWDNVKQLSLVTDFKEVSIAPWQSFPGFKYLSGNIKWNGTQGELNLSSYRAILQDPTLFLDKIALDQLFAKIQFQRDDAKKAWHLQIANMSLLNNDAAANISGSLMMPEGALPTVDLTANFTMQKISRLVRYLPFKIMEPAVSEWLKSAFLAGELKSGHAVLQGPLSAFPFEKNEGHFLVVGHFNNVDMRFAPDWPILRQGSGKLVFSKRQMVIDAEQAKILDVPIDRTHVTITHFGDAYPQVLDATVKAVPMDFEQGLKFIHLSPLEKNIGKMLRDMKMTGQLNLDLNLTVPLKKPENTQVKGIVTFDDATMRLVPWKLQLDHLQGNFEFTEKTITSNGINGSVFNEPIRITLDTQDVSKNTAIVRALFSSALEIKEIEAWLKLPMDSIVDGKATIKGEVDFSLQAPVKIEVQSDLVGVHINLPEQYGKNAEVPRNFLANLVIEEKQPLRLQFRYGDLLAGAILLNKANDKFNLISANIALGKSDASFSTAPGLTLSGELDELDWDSLKTYGAGSAMPSIAGLTLRSIDLLVREFVMGNQKLRDLRFNITRKSDSWNVILNSKDLDGQLQIPTTKNGYLNAQFKRINFPAASNKEKKAMSFNMSTLPPVRFVADKVSYDSIALGQLYFKTSPKQKGLTIESLRITSPYLNLQASGEWRQDNRTALQGNATSSNVQQLLSQFGFDVRNFISHEGKLVFNFNWQGAPYEPTLSNLSGSAKLNLGRGRIVDIGQESGAKMDLGRMLSIFSLQTIPRRLSFDFSDIFQKGYSFDSVRGDFNFNNGEARTRNLEFDGPVAKVKIDGSIGLNSKSYNFMLSVTPYVTSSLPIAATLISGPVIGAAAFAVNTILGSQFSKVATYYYQVTGPWANPTWKSVNNAESQR